ncbi:MAG: hypothetical protein NUV53_05265 [Patescibacteria group bacterium]|nr:hypothetical protein [Patescibacteria group bacterium]
MKQNDMPNLSVGIITVLAVWWITYTAITTPGVPSQNRTDTAGWNT